MRARILPRVAIAAGVVLGAVGAVSVPFAVPMCIALGATVGLGVACVVGDVTTVSGSPTRYGWRRSVVAGIGTTAGLLILLGLIAQLGPAAGTVVVALVCLAVLWSLLRGRRRGAPTRRDVANRPPGAVAAAPDLADASTAGLCVTWQRTYFAMLDLPAGPRRVDLVEVRRQLLDELERRDPDGFGRWLETGAGANSDPSRYLTQ